MKESIQIVSYDPAWPERFRLLAGKLRGALGATALRIDHIGSTAVPGLDAKPIIDIQLAVAELEPVEAYRVALADLGFVFRKDNPDRSKRYFREPLGEKRTHVHVQSLGSWGAAILAALPRLSACSRRRGAPVWRSKACARGAVWR